MENGGTCLAIVQQQTQAAVVQHSRAVLRVVSATRREDGPLQLICYIRTGPEPQRNGCGG
jgi:hypothetical protein